MKSFAALLLAAGAAAISLQHAATDTAAATDMPATDMGDFPATEGGMMGPEDHMAWEPTEGGPATHGPATGGPATAGLAQTAGCNLFRKGCKRSFGGISIKNTKGED